MAHLWYYWHEAEILGPFSGRQLVDLAAAGEILPDDVVWKEGVEGGIPAHKVQHLFEASLTTPSPQVSPSENAALPAPAPEVTPVAANTKEDRENKEDVKPGWDSGRPTPTSKARATAGKGAVLVGQDGKNVKFRLKCTTCGHEDSSWKTIAITRGTTRASFYCTKCRKRSNGEIHGHLS